jgi:hypothetical protein
MTIYSTILLFDFEKVAAQQIVHTKSMVPSPRLCLCDCPHMHNLHSHQASKEEWDTNQGAYNQEPAGPDSRALFWWIFEGT